jgi:hypothetical protein
MIKITHASTDAYVDKLLHVVSNRFVQFCKQSGDHWIKERNRRCKRWTRLIAAYSLPRQCVRVEFAAQASHHSTRTYPSNEHQHSFALEVCEFDLRYLKHTGYIVLRGAQKQEDKAGQHPLTVGGAF